MIDIERMAAHSTYALHCERMRGWPFPHLVVEDFLDPILFEVVRSLDLSDRVALRHPHRAEKPEGRRFSLVYSRPAVDDDPQVPEPVVTCRNVLAHALTSAAMLDIFRPVIRSRIKVDPVPWYPLIEMVEDRGGYSLEPHTDVRQKVVTCLIYLAEEGADPSLGTRLYAVRPGQTGLPDTMGDRRVRREALIEAATVPYRPNTALLFAPFLRSFHGVEETKLGTVRRLLQYQIVLDVDAYNAAYTRQTAAAGTTGQ